MYNRYIPQADGSYRRNRIPEPRPAPKPEHKPTPPPPQPPVSEPCPPPPPVVKPPASNTNPGFLRSLLPKGFDTGDLIVVLLLLLMAGDRPEDRNNAILTLALYFIM